MKPKLRAISRVCFVTDGLCFNRKDHKPHLVVGTSLGTFWCTADQSEREPYKSEKRRQVLLAIKKFS